MNKSIAMLVPLLIRGLTPSAAVTFGLLPEPSYSAPGDLDPSFGDFGRVGPMLNLTGAAWSLQSLSSGELLIAGGDYRCDSPSYCEYYNLPFTASGFLSELADSGVLDPAYSAGSLAHSEIFDVAPLPDGGAIAVGMTIVEKNQKLAVFRLLRDGTLDTSFGTGGALIAPPTLLNQQQATQVVLEPDGRIVVAGLRKDAYGAHAAFVLRLQPNGVLDASFGEGGIFVGPSLGTISSGTHLLRTASGAYRVSSLDCSIFGLTAAGQLDSTFGNAGFVALQGPPGTSVTCEALAAQPDDRLLVAGYDSTPQGFAARLLANGTPDASFVAGAVASGLADATAVSAGADGSIVVAGARSDGLSGAVVMRLQANGLLDTTFGKGGHTVVDLPSEWATNPVIYDLYVGPDGGVVAAGGASFNSNPFLVRLVGTGGSDQPGVLGVATTSISVQEKDGEAVVKVQRMGGFAGTVTVAYETQTLATDSYPAIAGQNYTAVSGRLSWSDGDTSDQEIHVPILAGNLKAPQAYFYIKLSAPDGAGIGTQTSAITITGTPSTSGGGGGGGGGAGSGGGGGAMKFVSLLFLAGAAMLRATRRVCARVKI